jgi:hypothetical protein
MFDRLFHQSVVAFGPSQPVVTTYILYMFELFGSLHLCLLEPALTVG